MKKNQYKVSIIIPIYNVENYLNDSLKSVVNQTMKEIEIILINDGSTDRSLEIIEKYREKDTRIKVIHQKNQGQSIARNQGINIANGEYVYFMDSDDIIDDNTVEICYKKSFKEDLDFLIFDSDVFFDSLELEREYENFKKNREKNLEDKVDKGKYILKNLLENKKFSCSPCIHFIKTSYLKKNNIKFYPKIIHEDELFAYELYLKSTRVNYIKEKFFKRRVRYNSTMTSHKTEKNINGYLIVAKELKRILKIENDAEKIEIINIGIKNMLNNMIDIISFLEPELKIKYRKIVNNEFKDYFNLKIEIKLNYPNLFDIIKKIKK